MSNAGPIRSEYTMDGSSLLAESVAIGLHSLAQPLTAAQCQLEMARMRVSDGGQDERELSEVLIALEHVVARLDILRDIIRPFRTGTEYKSESLKRALLCALEEQEDLFLHEGVNIGFKQSCEDGTIIAPQGFLQRISTYLLALMQALAPASVTFDISETGESVILQGSMVYPSKQQEHVIQLHSTSTLRTYVEVLTGDFLLSQDFSFIQISLPKSGRI